MDEGAPLNELGFDEPWKYKLNYTLRDCLCQHLLLAPVPHPGIGVLLTQGL